MYKRVLSIFLAIVLVFTLTAAASAAANVSGDIALGENEDHGLETIEQTIDLGSSIGSVDAGNEDPSDEFDQSDAEGGNGLEQPINHPNTTVSIDENGRAEIVIEIPLPELETGKLETGDLETDELETGDLETDDLEAGELEDGEPIPSEDESPTETEPPDNAVEPASTRDDYPITSFVLQRISGVVSSGDAAQEQKTENVPSSNQGYNFSYETRYNYVAEKRVKISLYAGGYGRESASPGTDGPGFWLIQNATQGLNVDITGAATAFQLNYELCNIDPAIHEANVTFVANTYDGKTVWTRNLKVHFAGDWTEAPTAPIYFTFDRNNPEQYTLNGINELMEYRRGYAGTWKPCTGNTMVFSANYSGAEFHVRYQAVDDLPASKFVTVVMPSRPAAPTTSINWVNESFKNLTTDMEISVGDGEYMPVTEEMIAGGATPFLDDVTGSSYVPLNIRYMLTDYQPVSYVTTIKLYPRADAPDEAALQLNPNTYVLTGVTSSMQYKGPQDTAWTAISSTSVNLSKYVQNDETVTILVRTKSSTGKSYSKPVEVRLEPPAAAPSTLELDYDNEKITGFLGGVTYQYKIGTGSWKSLTVKNLEYSITSLITSTERELSIRAAGTADTPMSGAWTVTLPARIAAPTCAFVYNDPSYVAKALLTGLEPGMEYQKKGDTSWTSYSGKDVVLPLPSANSTYYVRVAHTNSSFASTKKTLTLYAPATAPSSSLNITTEKITIAATAEYRIDNGAYTTLPSGTTTLLATQYIDELSGAETRTITVRYAATATKPASKEKTITLVARRDAPTTVEFDAETQNITGAATTMQYRVAGTETWKTVSKKTFSVASLISGQTNVVLEFRYKPANSLVGSKIAEVKCY